MGRKERAKRRKSPGGNFTLGGVAHEGGRRLPLRATDGCDGEGSSHFCQITSIFMKYSSISSTRSVRCILGRFFMGRPTWIGLCCTGVGQFL